MKLISLIIPVYNEEKNIPLVYREITKVFENFNGIYEHEIVFVNDGSKDNSWVAIKGVAQNDPKVKGINFSRNFGHQKAVEAGVNMAKGDAVVMMDGDLQHPPVFVAELIKKWEEGFEIVNTKRKDSQDVGFFKKVTSKFFYGLLNTISEVRLEDGAADFRLLDRKVVNVIRNLTEKEKFYRGLVNWVGFRVVTLEYAAKERMHGKSSYTLKKMISLARVGITSFSLLPMKVIIALGLFITLSSMIMLAVMFYFRWFINPAYFSSLAFLVVTIFISNGLILTVIGIIAIYLISIYKEIQNRPPYIVRETINFDSQECLVTR